MIDQFLALWLEAMSEHEYRAAITGAFGIAWGVVGWFVLEKLGRNAAAPVKKLYPAVVLATGLPVAIVLSIWIPGLLWRELAASMGLLGAATAHVSHETAKRLPPPKGEQADGGDS